MSVMIAQLCGVTDIHLLFTIAALSECLGCRALCWSPQPACCCNTQRGAVQHCPAREHTHGGAGLRRRHTAEICNLNSASHIVEPRAAVASTMLFGWQMEVSNGERLPTFAFTDDPKVWVCFQCAISCYCTRALIVLHRRLGVAVAHQCQPPLVRCAQLCPQGGVS